MEVYGQNEPPEYNLENIVAPISLCYSMNDYVVSIPVKNFNFIDLRHKINIFCIAYCLVSILILTSSSLSNFTSPFIKKLFFFFFQDLERLDSKLKSVVARYKVPHEKFNHIDFLWATDADKLIYIPTLKLMNSFVGFNLFL